MTNPYFNHDTPLTRHTLGRAEQVNAIFQAVEAGFDKLPNPDVIAEGRVTYVVDEGTANAYAVTLAHNLEDYVEGMSFVMKAGNANTGPATVDVNELGVKQILRFNGAPLMPGDIAAGMLVELGYDGEDFRVLSVHGGEVALARAWATSTTPVPGGGGFKGARGYAQDAAASASAASGSAGNAASSALAAAGSAQDALNHYNAFRGIFYGAAAADPAVDPNGNPPTVGDWYFNTTTKNTRIFNGSTWDDVGAGTLGKFVYTAEGGETSLSGPDDNGRPLAYSVGRAIVTRNGADLIEGRDFTASTGTSIDNLEPLAAGEVVQIVVFSTLNIADITADSLTDDPDELADISGKLLVSPAAAPAVLRSVISKLRDGPSLLDVIPSEYHNDIVAGTSTVDVQQWVQQAADYGGTWEAPRGRYMLGSPVVRENTGFHLRGHGVDSTIFEPTSGFSGSAVFTLGKKNVKDEARDICMSDFMIHMKARVDCGIEMYALRDGSTFRSVYLWEAHKTGFKTGWAGAGINDPWTMNQGLLFENCHVLSRRDGGVMSDGAYFDLSGLYETTLIGCKALGYGASGAVQNNMIGYLIGGAAVVPGDYDCQGVRLINCSVGGIVGTDNIGIVYGYATNCSDMNTTYEGVGHAVHWEARGGVSPSFCYTDTPRMYNPAGDVEVYKTFFLFKNSSISCGVRNMPTMSAMSGQILAQFDDDVIGCFVEVDGGDADPSTMVGDKVLFNAGNYSNYVRLYSAPTTTKQQAELTREMYSLKRLPDGTVIETTQFYTNIKAATTLRLMGLTGNPVVSIGADALGFFGTAPVPKPTVTGSRGGNAALGDLLAQLNAMGLITNSTTS